MTSVKGILISYCFGSFQFVYLYLPETANRTSPEIDQEFVAHKAQVPRKKWE